ncbi:MAG: glucans biosynthesis glucosyltransferase MdoH [Paracoccaceae bacterium]
MNRPGAEFASIAPVRSATPTAAPLAMPTQDLRRAPDARFRSAGVAVTAARIMTFGGAVVLTIYGARQMSEVFSPETGGMLPVMLSILFTVTFGWIAFSATQAVAGAIFRSAGPARAVSSPLTARTAIVMPVYNEDPAAVYGALAAMGEALAEIAPRGAFEIFILSDTRDPDIWTQETTGFAALSARLAGKMPVWYRRRRDNTARKAGNIREFIERWGGRYDLILSLDADSLMRAETILEMARRMQADDTLGLLQSAPRLAFGETLFARIQQFASRVYGKPTARGVAAWQGDDGNYWGHNAMIRVKAFASAAGLPDLAGPAPWGGHILSHDFIEAALMRRAGWRVVMDPALDGSWEGAPPSLSDFASRDRRWAQGNLQHLGVIGARGLRWPSRAHLAIGIGSYLASPLWLLMLLVGFALTTQVLLSQPEYFPLTYQLFPVWPRFDSERMTLLMIGTFGLLLTPKLIGFAEAMASRGARREAGGGGALAADALLELVLSALYAPVMMLIQTRQLFDILRGRDSGWSAQSRSAGRASWRGALAAHAWHCFAGVAMVGALAYLDPGLLIWLSPVLAGLALSPALALASGSGALGGWLARRGLLIAPEHRAPDPVIVNARAATAEFGEEITMTAAALMRAPDACAAHVATLDMSTAPNSDEETMAGVTARAKIEAAALLGDPFKRLTKEERIAVLSSATLLSLLTSAPRPERAAEVARVG